MSETSSPFDKIKKNQKVLIPASVAAIAVAATLGMMEFDKTKNSKPVTLSTLAEAGSNRTIKDVTLDPSVSTLENIASHPFAQTTAQDAIEIARKETWKNATIIMAKDEDGKPTAFLAKATAQDTVSPKNQEAVELTDDTISAISIEGSTPRSVEDLLLAQDVGPADDTYDKLVREYVALPELRPVID